MGFGAFFSAVSGLKGHLFSMSVVGNNIANANTIGYKSGTATFREALVQTLRGASPPRQGGGGVNPMQLGLGMEVASIHSDFGQGMLQETGIVTDLAIEGEGFFVLNQGESRLFSRSGNFSFDADGNLTARGTSHIVQGWLADANGRIPTGAPTEAIKLPFGQSIPGRPTTEVRFDSNLDASATTATARLIDSGTSGIQVVSGLAKDGAGGRHDVIVTGANASQSTALGTHLVGGPLTGSETLTSLGVTDATIEISVDGSPARAVNGLTVNSTVGDLVNSINALEMGVMASIDGGEVRLTRDKYGDGSFFNASTSTAVAGNIARQVFGAAVGATFDANSGSASTLAATSQFTPTGKPALNSVNLQIVMDSQTGLATGVEGIGGGGITATANNGLTAGTLSIETESTEHLSSILLFDSLGNEHTLNMTFRRSGVSNLWYWEAGFDGGESIVGGRSGTVNFNTDGSLQSWLFDNGGDQLIVNPGPDADPMQVSVFAGTPEAVDGLTQYASPFTAKASSQDGFAMGALSSISIDNAGMITGFFTNGVLQNMGQVVLAKFNNSDGLDRVGGNLYRQSANSGDGIIGGARTTIPASIASGALEMSNVDLSEEFVNMIVAQRGFQANARIITTGDEMMTDMINLKR